MKADFVAFVIRETSGTSRRASFSKIVQIDTDAILGIQTKKKARLACMSRMEMRMRMIRSKRCFLRTTSLLQPVWWLPARVRRIRLSVIGGKQSGNPYNKQDAVTRDYCQRTGHCYPGMLSVLKKSRPLTSPCNRRLMTPQATPSDEREAEELGRDKR